MDHLVKFVHSATGIEAQQTQLLLIVFHPGTLHIERKFNTLFLLLDICTFSSFLHCQIFYRICPSSAPQLHMLSAHHQWASLCSP